MKYVIILLTIFMTKFSKAQFKDTLLSINGTTLFVREIGSGSPIILIHGGPGLNHSYFLPHLKLLGKKHRVIFYDQRACGNSAGDLDSTQMNLSLFVEDIEEIRKRLNLGKVAILSHSWGGLVAMNYASKYSRNISAMILSNSVSPKFGEFEKETNQRLKLRIPVEDSILRSEILKSSAFKSGELESYTKLFKLSFKPSFYNRDRLEKMQLILPADFLAKRRVLFFMTKELSAYDFYNNLKSIFCPVLVIHGEYDGVPVELSQKIQDNITGAKLVLMKDAGHFPFIENAKEYRKIVEHFLMKSNLKTL